MKRAAEVLIATLVTCALYYPTDAFIPCSPLVSKASSTSSLSVGAPVSQEKAEHQKKSFFLSLDEIKPIITLNNNNNNNEGNSSLKVINAFGLWCAVVSLALAPIWILAMTIVKMLHNMNENFDPQRAIYDK